MDFSKQYIKMCEEAKEIQEYHKFETGDFIFDKIVKAIGIIIARSVQKIYFKLYPDIFILENNESPDCGVIKIYIPDDPQRLVWLPRQDQLQAIITTNKYFRFSLIELFYHFANKNVPKFTSMEQLWLAYVMYIKYKKIWNNEKEK